MRESNIKRNEIIAIILARSGSKSIKHKNLKKLKDRPLISWAIEACRKSKMIKKVKKRQKKPNPVNPIFFKKKLCYKT